MCSLSRNKISLDHLDLSQRLALLNAQCQIFMSSQSVEGSRRSSAWSRTPPTSFLWHSRGGTPFASPAVRSQRHVPVALLCLTALRDGIPQGEALRIEPSAAESHTRRTRRLGRRAET